MAKKPTTKPNGQLKPVDHDNAAANANDLNASANHTEAAEPQADQTQKIDKAIEAGLELIKAGKTKIEAAMAIYVALEDLPQDTVVVALIKGATLTAKGALTYWYNCRRKLKKQRAAS